MILHIIIPLQSDLPFLRQVKVAAPVDRGGHCRRKSRIVGLFGTDKVERKGQIQGPGDIEVGKLPRVIPDMFELGLLLVHRDGSLGLWVLAFLVGSLSVFWL